MPNNAFQLSTCTRIREIFGNAGLAQEGFRICLGEKLMGFQLQCLLP
ncbi:hypothetical protein HanXRQr2_Chr12g0562421 [Helianthus annuus]|uniref:Uncharacterized protein n=1 Tax=Helianthus annuus TaxID=4232 RepID=A0A9K3HK09_HELAN|nr:hypothetical protein HanXRQr2_Chr12g0562421 [Helianthus annuus]KAJ0864431.1 hypothetical protein HanPSC8_Chr12g0541921 [Helianthus annuus]